MNNETYDQIIENQSRKTYFDNQLRKNPLVLIRVKRNDKSVTFYYESRGKLPLRLKKTVRPNQ